MNTSQLRKQLPLDCRLGGFLFKFLPLKRPHLRECEPYCEQMRYPSLDQLH